MLLILTWTHDSVGCQKAAVTLKERVAQGRQPQLKMTNKHRDEKIWRLLNHSVGLKAGYTLNVFSSNRTGLLFYVTAYIIVSQKVIRIM